MRGRQLVWSSKEIQALAKEFITVADEVYWLDPEFEGHRAQVQNNPEYRFFQRFGRQVPPPHWNERGTKQGIYVIGPDAEYLGARFASPGADEVARMLREAKARWETVRRERGYAPQAVPPVASKFLFPERAAQAGLWLQVNSRDLPRQPGGREGGRFAEVGGRTGDWGDFRRWAWNQSFFAVAPNELAGLLPQDGAAREVPAPLFRRLVRQQLVDNVRGQIDEWRDGEIREASLRVERVSRQGDVERVRYRGRVEAGNAQRTFRGDLFGLAEFDHAKGRFTRFDLVATGTRTGRGRFNNRNGDEGPAPVGYAFALEDRSPTP